MQRDNGYFMQDFKTMEYQVFLLLDNCSFLRPGMVKQKLVAQLGLIIQEEKLRVAPALLQHSCFSFPPSPHPQDSVKAECETETSVFKVKLGSRPIPDAGGVAGRNFSPIPKDQVDAARPRWNFAAIFKANWYPLISALVAWLSRVGMNDPP